MQLYSDGHATITAKVFKISIGLKPFYSRLLQKLYLVYFPNIYVYFFIFVF